MRRKLALPAALAVALFGARLPLAASAQDFGSPPSGEIPILYNDHTVYAKPDILKHNRVLAALVRDGRIYVPLRSMFEQMGATVAASANGRTITASKPDVTVSVTLDKAEVVVNGESRPLDIPPMMYKGVMLVPVRVLSEALGAYVQWVQSKNVVVVRYIPPMPVATPPPVPAATPTAVPTPVPTLAPPIPTPAPTAVPTARPFPGYVQAAVSHVNNYNELSAGNFCESYLVDIAYTFDQAKYAVKVDYRADTYVTSDNLTDLFGNHYTRFATIGGGTAFTPVFMARQSSLDARLEYKIANPRIYVGAGYLHTNNNYGYPQLNGAGFGVEKLLDLRPGIDVFGSAFYYPSASGNYAIPSPAGVTYNQRYGILKYDLGLALVFARIPVYVYGGYSGDKYFAMQNAPIGQAHDGPYIGLGVKL
jgi:hypothetical protein